MAKYFFALIVFCVLFSGCAGTYRVGVEFSPALRDHFIEYPTIEVDVAAVTDKEADEVKQLGVEKYFAPNSGIREQLHGETFFFFRGGQNTFLLDSKNPVWSIWRRKKPTHVMVIASLPHDPSISSQDDPRSMTVKMTGRRIRFWRRTSNINIQVEPKRIILLTEPSSGK